MNVGNFASIWVLANPDSGSQTLSFTTDGAFGAAVGGGGGNGEAWFSAYSLANAVQTNPTVFDSTTGGGTNSTSLSFTNVAAGSFAVDSVIFNGGDQTITFSQTEQLDTDLFGGGSTGGSSYLANASGDFTFIDTLTANGSRIAQSAIVVQAIPEPGAASLVLALAGMLTVFGSRRPRKA